MKITKLLVLSLLFLVSCVKSDTVETYYIAIECQGDNSEIVESHSAAITAFNQMRIEMSALISETNENWTSAIRGGYYLNADNEAKAKFRSKLSGIRSFVDKWNTNFSSLKTFGQSSFDIQYQYVVCRISPNGNIIKLEKFDFGFCLNK